MVYSVQYLRFFAAFVVLLLHSFEGVGIEFRQGQFGVDVFFVISGFVIYLASERASKGGVFFLRRFLRVALPYYVMLLIVIADVLFFGLNAYFFGELSVREVLFSFLFVFQQAEGGTFTLPIYKIGWTLNYEMFFYLIFSLAILVSHGNRLTIVAGVILALCAVQWVFRFDGGTWYMHQTRTAVEFIYGMLIAVLYLRFAENADLARRMLPLGAVLAAAGLVLLAIAPEASPYSGNRFVFVGIPAAMLLAGVLVLEVGGRIPKIPVLFYLGGASYSIYLVHYVVTKSVGSLAGETLPDEKPLILLGMIGLSLGLALVFHHVVERPMHRFSRSFKSRPRQRAGQVGVSH